MSRTTAAHGRSLDDVRTNGSGIVSVPVVSVIARLVLVLGLFLGLEPGARGWMT
jgi:hypothetical protein